MTDTQHDTTVPRATLEAVAKGYHELNALHRQMSRTQALMIRECLRRITAVPNRNLFGIERMAEDRKVRTNRLEAIEGLRELADMLEKQGAEPST